MCHGGECAQLALLFAAEEVAESIDIFGEAEVDAMLAESPAESFWISRGVFAREEARKGVESSWLWFWQEQGARVNQVLGWMDQGRRCCRQN